MIRFFPSSDSMYPSPFEQLAAGLGKNKTHPIIFDEWDDFEDAYFSASDFQPPSNGTEFRNCTSFPGMCVSLYDLPFTHFGFGQNGNNHLSYSRRSNYLIPAQSDWILNDCIVYHELTHAMVYKLVPELASYIWSNGGIMSDPGAMNEAWADYFGAISCKINGDFSTETYNHKPMRSMLEEATCR